MTTRIRTVRGDIPAGELGRTDYHEHLLQSSLLLPGDDLDDVDRAVVETRSLRASGFDALVELTPIGLARDPAGLVEISRRAGVHVVMATGVHREAHYADEHPIRRLDRATLADLFTNEINTGVDRDERGVGPSRPVEGVRAGVIKVGTGYWSISSFERRILGAAADTQRRTGACIVCHLELGTAAWEVLELLVAEGARSDRVVLAHADRNPDPALHLDLAAAGAYLGYDGAARVKYWPDSVLVDCLVRVAEGGGADRLLLGGDVARRSSFVSYGGLPGMAYLGRRFVPRLAAAAGDDLVDRVIVTNPARAFTIGDR
ncbi:MAG: phosphotriesterase family protein [Jiangellaceae bacterium]